MQLLLFADDVDCHQGADQQQVGVEQVLHDVEGRQGNAHFGTGGDGPLPT